VTLTTVGFDPSVARRAGCGGAGVHVPFLNEAFGTAPLSLDQWLVCFAMASVVLWSSELRKFLLRVRGESAADDAPRRPARRR
jgi:hypothetical protein